MANIVSYKGFMPVGGVDQKGHGGTKAYFVPASVAESIGVGDVVIKTNGLNAKAIHGIPANTLPTCKPATAALGTTKATGIVAGVMPVDAYAPVEAHGKGGTDRVVFVMEDLNAEFKVRANAGKTVKVGHNADIVYAAPVLGSSSVSLEASATTATLPFRVVGVVTSPDNDASAECAEYIVRLNNSSEAQGVAGV